MQKFSTAWVLALVLAGCNGAIVGNFAVLALSVGIFVGTLSLGKSPRS